VGAATARRRSNGGGVKRRRLLVTSGLSEQRLRLGLWIARAASELAKGAAFGRWSRVHVDVAVAWP